jgi:hypothetical protein
MTGLSIMVRFLNLTPGPPAVLGDELDARDRAYSGERP